MSPVIKKGIDMPMFKSNKKLTSASAGALIACYSTMTPILAKPKPNTAGVEKEIKPWLDSALDIGLWLVPLIGLIACIVHTVTYLAKDEDDKNQKPVWKVWKRTIFIVLVAELLQVFFKTLGL